MTQQQVNRAPASDGCGETWCELTNAGQPIYQWSKQQQQGQQQQGQQQQEQQQQQDAQSGAQKNAHDSQYQTHSQQHEHHQQNTQLSDQQSANPSSYQTHWQQQSFAGPTDQAAYGQSTQYGGQGTLPTRIQDFSYAGYTTKRDSHQDHGYHAKPLQPAAGHASNTGSPPYVGKSHHQNDVIRGTPGKSELLDPSYSMREGADAHRFFVIGRVFAVLWTETAGDTIARQAGTEGTVRFHNDAITIGRFGQPVYSQIRRFVIVKVRVKGHFVYACPISTYSRRGTLKFGCYPAEHAIVYFSNTVPQYVEGEYGNGMTKEPIEVIPTDPSDTMHPASRLRFGKSYPVEWNVKVKDIGKVHPAHISKLLQYYKEEED
jgi:hypothetical protein